MRSIANSLLESVSTSLAELGVSNCRLLVAVSGGGDSVGLTLVLSELSPIHSLDIVIAHFDHKTRERHEHACDRSCVQALSRRVHAPLFLGAAARPPDRAAATNRGGHEAYAREQRYRFLRDASRVSGARYCVTAHTRDDQVETVAMRLLAGMDSPLLSGIPRRRHFEGVECVRPALSIGGAELRDYASAAGVEFREDVTNTNLHYRRNLMRHVILPAARSRWPDLDDDLLELGRAYAERTAARANAASRIRTAERAGRVIFASAEFYRLGREGRLSFLYRLLHERGLISRNDRPSHRFFEPLLHEGAGKNGILLEGRGIRFVASGPRIELSRTLDSL